MNSWFVSVCVEKEILHYFSLHVLDAREIFHQIQVSVECRFYCAKPTLKKIQGTGLEMLLFNSSRQADPCNLRFSLLLAQKLSTVRMK
jgi:hypothetical protein